MMYYFTHIRRLLTLSGLFFVLMTPWLANADSPPSFPELSQAGFLFNSAAHPRSSHANQPFIPASTTKLVTAWLALNHWGEDYRFHTPFYWDDLTETLWIKGRGDPFLTSEELQIIAKNLKRYGLKNIKAIGLDNSFFQSGFIALGSNNSSNPYDAIPTAIATNFNTVSLKKVAGELKSAEQQTPLTATARSIATQFNINRPLRVNTGKSSKTAETHFAELLTQFLKQQDIAVGSKIIWGKAPKQSAFYIHKNSKTLAEMIKPMLKYSTNFIANQLVLILSADYFQRPANFADVQLYMELKLKEKFHWKNFTLKDGAGLSRENRLSPQQLVELLEAFRPWKQLLPEVTKGIYAKSGTLHHISTLAGYSVDDQQHWYPFALMMTQSVYHKRRNAIAKALATP